MSHKPILKRFLRAVSTIFFILARSFVGRHQIGVIHGRIVPRDASFEFNYLTIEVKNLNKGSRIDSLGNFNLSLLEGKYSLILKCVIGMRDTTINNIEVKTDSILRISIPYPPICVYKNEISNCPICNKNDKSIPISYGLPFNSTLRKAKRGKVKLGGCVITDCEPNWFCKRDNINF